MLGGDDGLLMTMIASDERPSRGRVTGNLWSVLLCSLTEIFRESFLRGRCLQPTDLSSTCIYLFVGVALNCDARLVGCDASFGHPRFYSALPSLLIEEGDAVDTMPAPLPTDPMSR